MDNGITDRAMKYGTPFCKPKRRTVKLPRREKAHQFFEPSEIHAMLDVADAPMRAILLLGANCGLGNDDINNLTVDDLDLSAGLLDLYRHKTGEERRAVLWPETIEAVAEALHVRPKPYDDTLATRVFITTHGREWVLTMVHDDKIGPRVVRSDNVAQRFRTLRTRAKILGEGRGFYTFRHTYRTVVDAASDRPAVDLTMGHENAADIRSAYVDARSIGVNRLRSVADHVHRWLWP